MIKSKGHLQIDILGTSFAIEAAEKDQYLQSIYAYYRKTVEDVEKKSGIGEPLKAAIIAGLLLADELAKERANPEMFSQIESDMQIIEQSTMKMLSELDTIIASLENPL